MTGSVKTITSAASKTAASFREAIQDLLVPELRAVKVSVDALRMEMQLRDEQQSKNLASLREEMRLRNDSSSEEMRLRDERQTKAIQTLSEKLDFPIDIRERLVQVEARLPRQ